LRRLVPLRSRPPTLLVPVHPSQVMLQETPAMLR
jgi:hypothetical protein